MKKIDGMTLAAAVCLAGAVLAGPSAAADYSGRPDANESASDPAGGLKNARSVVDAWPDESKTAALALIDKYGTPDVVSNGMISWNDRNEWRMVAVFRNGPARERPMAHEDIIENKVSYMVPEDKVAALSRFDHSLVIDQSRGTLASHSDSEEHNVLALNLADEIVTGKRDVASARRLMRKTLEESMAGKSSRYSEDLMFTPSDETGRGIHSAAPAQTKGESDAPLPGANEEPGRDYPAPAGIP